MTFNDLHIMQQMGLVADYLDEAYKLKRVPGEVYYRDEKHNIDINVTRLRTHCKTVWLPVLVDETFITFETDDFNMAEQVIVNFASLKQTSKNTIGGSLRPFGKYGLIQKKIMTGDVVKTFTAMRSILKPFSEPDSVEDAAVKSIDLILKAIDKIKELPDEFFDEIKIDVGLQNVVRKIAIITNYNSLVDNVKATKRVPDIERVDEHTLRMFFEDHTKPEMVVTMGHNGPDIKVQLIPATGEYEGGMFHVVAKPTINEIGSDILATIVDIINDCTFSDELQPHLRRYMRHLKPAIKHVKNCNKL